MAHDFDLENLCKGDSPLPSRYMTIGEAILLIECLMQGAVTGDDHNSTMYNFEAASAKNFIAIYTQRLNGFSGTAWCDAVSTRDMLVDGRRLPTTTLLNVQFHLVCLEWAGTNKRKRMSLSEHFSGLILGRHSAKIRRLSHSRTTSTAGKGRISTQNSNDKEMEDYFTEYRLSTSLYLYGQGGDFRLVLVGDPGALTKFNPQTEYATSSLRFDSRALDHLAGLSHFLVAMVHLMDVWYKKWEMTLRIINNIVGFEVKMTHGNYSF